MKILKYSILMYLVFSMSLLVVFADYHAPTPGDAFSSTGNVIGNIYNFFKGIVSGSASVSDSNFIVFLLYFILFLAIYTEGLRFLKFFGDRGELNKPGKAFGFAAALLSCLALFLTNKEHVFASLVSPFGVWGGTVIAAVIGYISYKFIKDADLFEEDVMTQMAGATAIGVTFAGFLLGLNSLMGWGFLIMLLVFGVGAAKSFSSNSSDDTSERTRRPRRTLEEERTERDANRTGRTNKTRKNKLAHVLSNLLHAMNDGRDLLTSLRKGRTTRARPRAAESSSDQYSQFVHHIDQATRDLRRILRKEKNSGIHHFLDDMYRHTGVALETVEGIGLPTHDMDDSSWAASESNAGPQIERTRALCRLIHDRLDRCARNPEDLETIADTDDIPDNRGRRRRRSARDTEEE